MFIKKCIIFLIYNKKKYILKMYIINLLNLINIIKYKLYKKYNFLLFQKLK